MSDKTPEKKYKMWSDGNVTSFGELVGTEGDALLIKHPAYVIFDVSDRPYETPEGTVGYKKHMSFHVTPYMFPAVVREGDMVWKINPRHSMHKDPVFHEKLIEIYNNVIELAANIDKGEDK